MSATVEPTAFSAEDFFRQQPPPPGLDAHLEAVKAFVERNASEGRKVVLVTVSSEPLLSCVVRVELSLTVFELRLQSGGTTVPLEQNV